MFAGGLSDLGIAQGDIVTLFAANSWEWVVSYYAVVRIGAVINPVNTMLMPNEIEYVVKDCGSKAIIASQDKIETIQGVKKVSDVDIVICFGGDNKDKDVISLDSLITARTNIPPMPEVSPNSMVSIAYTSGTTGHPKGAMQSHRAIILNTAMTSQMHMRGVDDIVVSALPCPHVYANVLMNGMLMCGTTLVLHDKFDAVAILTDISKYKATIFDGCADDVYVYVKLPAID